MTSPERPYNLRLSAKELALIQFALWRFQNEAWSRAIHYSSRTAEKYDPEAPAKFEAFSHDRHEASLLLSHIAKEFPRHDQS